MNLSQTILGVTFENPTVLASGILGITASTWKDVAAKGAGAITTKSLWAEEHKGHPNPTIIETDHWMLNAVGLPDAGPANARAHYWQYAVCITSSARALQSRNTRLWYADDASRVWNACMACRTKARAGRAGARRKERSEEIPSKLSQTNGGDLGRTHNSTLTKTRASYLRRHGGICRTLQSAYRLHQVLQVHPYRAAYL